jgi:hypothetical protein
MFRKFALVHDAMHARKTCVIESCSLRESRSKNDQAFRYVHNEKRARSSCSERVHPTSQLPPQR